MIDPVILEPHCNEVVITGLLLYVSEQIKQNFQ